MTNTRGRIISCRHTSRLKSDSNLLYVFTGSGDADMKHDKVIQLEESVSQLESEVDTLKSKNNVSIYLLYFYLVKESRLSLLRVMIHGNVES